MERGRERGRRWLVGEMVHTGLKGHRIEMDWGYYINLENKMNNLTIFYNLLSR